mgnify:CR=1 FL=1
MCLKQQKVNELEIVNQRELLQYEINGTERTQKRIAQELHDQTALPLGLQGFFA